MSGLPAKRRPAARKEARDGEGAILGPKTTPTAKVTVEPVGPRTALPRRHSITVAISSSSSAAPPADEAHLREVVHRALDGDLPSGDEPDRREHGDFSPTREWQENGGVSVAVAVVGPSRPADPAVEQLRAALVADGYRVTVREKRECAETACSGFALVDWNQPARGPAGWYTNSICGKHNYKACSGCGSTYVMTSSSSVGQAPSVVCQVCGEVMVEWGSSKLWDAQLITRGNDRA